MTEEDHEPLIARLSELWYRKFPEAELADWCQRMARYRLRDVMAALDAHKAESKFAPRVSEILARLKGKEEGGSAAREQSWCEVQRRLCPWLGDAGDVETIIRVHRQQFHEARRGPGYRPQVLASCVAHLAAVYPFAPTDAEAYPKIDDDGAVTSARSVTSDEAADMAGWIDRTADLIFATPDVFRLALDDLRRASAPPRGGRVAAEAFLAGAKA